MTKGQGVVYIKYVDNNISSGMNWACSKHFL